MAERQTTTSKAREAKTMRRVLVVIDLTLHQRGESFPAET
jgi:hypothetical protein